MAHTNLSGLIPVDPPLHAWFFQEIDCPICRHVYYNIMLPMQREGYIKVYVFEINANHSTPEVDWFNKYSEWGREALTPTIRIVDRHMDDYKFVNYPVRVLHLWDTKEDYVTQEDIETSELLKEHIMEAVQSYKRRAFKRHHKQVKESSINVPKRWNPWVNGNTS